MVCLAKPVNAYQQYTSMATVTSVKSTKEWAARVSACNSVNSETSRNLPPVLIIVVKYVIKCSIFTIILTRLWASIGVTRSYSSHPVFMHSSLSKI